MKVYHIKKALKDNPAVKKGEVLAERMESLSNFISELENVISEIEGELEDLDEEKLSNTLSDKMSGLSID